MVQVWGVDGLEIIDKAAHGVHFLLLEYPDCTERSRSTDQSSAELPMVWYSLLCT